MVGRCGSEGLTIRMISKQQLMTDGTSSVAETPGRGKRNLAPRRVIRRPNFQAQYLGKAAALTHH